MTDPRNNGQKSTSANPQTVLTAEAEFRGALAFSGDLQLNGRLEGTIESDGGCLIIGKEAVVNAEIKVHDVIIFGKVQGNVTAQGRVEVRGDAHLYGDIKAGRVMIEDGATFVGRSESTTAQQKAPDFNQMFSRLGGAGKSKPAASAVHASPERSATPHAADRELAGIKA